MNPAGYKESQRVLEFLIKHQDKFVMPHISVNDAAQLLNDPCKKKKRHTECDLALLTMQ
jgi:hypothetical protein